MRTTQLSTSTSTKKAAYGAALAVGPDVLRRREKMKDAFQVKGLSLIHAVFLGTGIIGVGVVRTEIG